MTNVEYTWLDESLQTLAESLVQSTAVCEHTATVCERMDGADACRRACRDCADLSALLVRFIHRHAVLTPELSEVCAKACDMAASECGRYEGETFRQCEEITTRCTELCNLVAA